MAQNGDDSAGASREQVQLAAKVVLYGFGVVALVLGLVAGTVVVGGLSDRRQALASADATTEGTVVDSTVERVSTSTESSDIYDYEVRIEYRYTVDGEEYTGRDIYPERATVTRDTEEAARKFAAPYDEGSTVTVHYNPESPGQAFIVAKRTALLKVVGGLGATLMFLLGGIGAIWKGSGVGDE